MNKPTSPSSSIARQSIFSHSKSFSLASIFFDHEMKESVYNLYFWCRYCDDVIDSQSHDRSEQLRRLAELERLTREAYQGNARLPVFQSFSIVVQKHGIPLEYALELLAGFRMDIEKCRYETPEDLDRYAFRVAGVVGLMMCHIMGISDSKALNNAAKLGMAMQFTNILRDIAEDKGMGRVYLPQLWLRLDGITEDSLLTANLQSTTRKLFDRAETYYKEGERGLLFLPLRAALAVSAARHIYREIGIRVLQSQTVNERAVVPLGRKLILCLKAWAQVAAIYFRRPRFQPVSISQIWKLST